MSIRPANPATDQLVFTSPTGLPIHNTRFTNQVWRGGRNGRKHYKGIVTDLVNQGLVERYRCPYTCRHTFATMALENGLSVPQVAKLLGNSPQVTMQHYVSNLLKIDVPVV